MHLDPVLMGLRSSIVILLRLNIEIGLAKGLQPSGAVSSGFGMGK